jgi:hypothetical protein
MRGMTPEPAQPDPPPKTFRLEDTAGDPPRAGMVVWAAIHSFVQELQPFNVPDMGLGVGLNDQGYPGFWYEVKESDLGRRDASDWLFIWIKMNSFVRTLSIVDFSNLWLGDRLWYRGKLVWQRPKAVPLITDKEGDPANPERVFTASQLAHGLVNLAYHIATNFPRVWAYHETGSYLLRTSFPGYEFNADILLNFFKIGELVTASMYGVKPKLAHIQRASAELDIVPFTREEIREFYKVRSRDAAHDWLNTKPVDRALAVDCKMWSELMVLYHWHQRGKEVAVLLPKGATPNGSTS